MSPFRCSIYLLRSNYSHSYYRNHSVVAVRWDGRQTIYSLGPPRVRCISTGDYSSSQYWQEFYQKKIKRERQTGVKKPSMEWFLDSSTILECLASVVLPGVNNNKTELPLSRTSYTNSNNNTDSNLASLQQIPILHVGCGLSELGQQISCLHSCLQVTNIDSSEIAVQTMRQNHGEDVKNCIYLVADMLNTGFADCSFLYCIDKGSMDAVSKGSNSEAAAVGIRSYCAEMHRVLLPGGTLIQITEDPTDIRLAELKTVSLPWEAKLLRTIETADWQEPYYVYTITKAK